MSLEEDIKRLVVKSTPASTELSSDEDALGYVSSLLLEFLEESRAVEDLHDVNDNDRDSLVHAIGAFFEGEGGKEEEDYVNSCHLDLARGLIDNALELAQRQQQQKQGPAVSSSVPPLLPEKFRRAVTFASGPVTGVSCHEDSANVMTVAQKDGDGGFNEEIRERREENAPDFSFSLSTSSTPRSTVSSASTSRSLKPEEENTTGHISSQEKQGFSPSAQGPQQQKRQRRRNRRENKKKTKGKVPDEERMKKDAKDIKEQAAVELEELDDYSTAWKECVESGGTWGGRGRGGRGLRSVHSSCASDGAVRSVHLSNVSLQFSGNDLLQNATVQITEGKRYGLIGRNGVGKSTFLRRLESKSIPGFPVAMRVCLVQQEVEGSAENTGMETLLKADEARTTLLAEQKNLEEIIDRAADAAEAQTNDKEDRNDNSDIVSLGERLNFVLEELDAIDADGAEQRARDILRGLQFTEEMISSPTDTLSGGWKMRLALARALFVPSDLLLLDEPTNHLDLYACLWLAEYLAHDGKTLVLVSHDRSFLDEVCTDIIHFDKQKLKYHPGNFSAFERQMEEKAARETQILDASERKRAKAEAFIEKQSRSHTGKRGHDPNKQRQAKMIREKKLDRIGNYREDGKRYKNFSLKQLSEDSVRLSQKVTVEVDDPVPKFKFPDPAWSPGMRNGSASTLITLDDVSFGYDASLPPILRAMTLCVGAGSKVAIVGKNGAGKSTLLGLVTGELEKKVASSGTKKPLKKGETKRHPHLRIGHVAQHDVELLDEYGAMTVVEYAGERLSQDPATLETSFTSGAIRQYLGAFGLGGKHANRVLASLSGGERMRLCFATTFATRPHLLVLDEPTNHLDIETLDALSLALQAFKGAILIVSHNQRFLTAFCNELWIVEKGQVYVRHSDEYSFEENFAQYRNETVLGVQGRSERRQNKASRAKQSSRQRSGVAQRSGFVS